MHSRLIPEEPSRRTVTLSWRFISSGFTAYAIPSWQPWRTSPSPSMKRKSRTEGKRTQDQSKGKSPSQKKILVVEDHPDSREILVVQLQRMTCEVIEAASGEEAIEKASAEGPNLIIMDLGLPGINGLETTARLKKNPKTAHIPVVALTAWPEQDYKNKALQAGTVEYLTKPTPPQVLKQVIERFLH